MGVESAEEELEEGKEHDDGEDGHRHLRHIVGKALGKIPGRLPGGFHLGDGHRGIGRIQFRHHDAQDHHRQNGADGAQGDETEGVVAGVLIASDGRHTDTQRHDKGHRDGAGGNAAGIKGHRHKVVGHKEGQGEHQDVEKEQGVRQGDVEEHTHLGNDQEEAHTQRHRQNEGHVGHGGQLLGQHLQVRLCNGDHHTQHKTYDERAPHSPALTDLNADTVAHGDHGHIHAQGEQAHAEHQQQRAEEEEHQSARGERCDGDADDQNDGGDGKHRRHGLFNFFE